VLKFIYCSSYLQCKLHLIHLHTLILFILFHLCSCFHLFPSIYPFQLQITASTSYDHTLYFIPNLFPRYYRNLSVHNSCGNFTVQSHSFITLTLILQLFTLSILYYRPTFTCHLFTYIPLWLYFSLFISS
jgi:hypothetical protein